MVSCSFSGFSPHQPIEGIERPRAGFYPLSGIPEYLAVAIKPHIDAILTGLSFAKALPGSLYRCTKSGDFKTTISNKLNYIQYIYILTYIEYTYVYLYIRIYIYILYLYYLPSRLFSFPLARLLISLRWRERTIDFSLRFPVFWPHVIMSHRPEVK